MACEKCIDEYGAINNDKTTDSRFPVNYLL